MIIGIDSSNKKWINDAFVHDDTVKSYAIGSHGLMYRNRSKTVGSNALKLYLYQGDIVEMTLEIIGSFGELTYNIYSKYQSDRLFKQLIPLERHRSYNLAIAMGLPSIHLDWIENMK